jgi:cytoskeletal protein RodZ
MSSLGELLRERREEHRWTLDDVSQRTRIRREYLTALEEGNYAALPADVHVRGFLRNYANVLGLSAQELLDLYRHDRGDPDLVSIAPLVPPPKSRSCALPSLGFAIFATLAMAVCAYWVYYGWLHPAVPSPTPTLPAPTPTNILLTATPTLRVLVGPPTATLTQPGPTQATYNGVEVVLQMSADCWVQVWADNVQVYQGILRAVTSRTFTARQELRIRMGNAGGVRVTFNGQDLGVLGASGQVLERVWKATP